MPIKIAKIHPKTHNLIAVVPSCDLLLEKAVKLARKLCLPLITNKEHAQKFPLLLTITEEHLELRENAEKSTSPIFVDFLSPKMDYRIKHGGGKKQLLAKAIGIKNRDKPVVLDATAGFGIDSFVMASLGCEVIMVERSPIMNALLEDGLDRLKKNEKTKGLKMNLHHAQSIDYIDVMMTDGSKQIDVIYLDPMYPKRKKTALNKKTMRILHQLVGDDSDASELLDAALKFAKKRVVVKRPKDSEFLGGRKPDIQLSSEGSSRYDVYLIKQL